MVLGANVTYMQGIDMSKLTQDSINIQQALLGGVAEEVGQCLFLFLPPDHQVELDGGDNLNEAFLMDEVHPPQAAYRPSFMKPPPPSGRKQRSRSPGRPSPLPSPALSPAPSPQQSNGNGASDGASDGASNGDTNDTAGVVIEVQGEGEGEGEGEDRVSSPC